MSNLEIKRVPHLNQSCANGNSMVQLFSFTSFHWRCIGPTGNIYLERDAGWRVASPRCGHDRNYRLKTWSAMWEVGYFPPDAPPPVTIVGN